MDTQQLDRAIYLAKKEHDAEAITAATRALIHKNRKEEALALFTPLVVNKNLYTGRISWGLRALTNEEMHSARIALIEKLTSENKLGLKYINNPSDLARAASTIYFAEIHLNRLLYRLGVHTTENYTSLFDSQSRLLEDIFWAITDAAKLATFISQPAHESVLRQVFCATQRQSDEVNEAAFTLKTILHNQYNEPEFLFPRASDAHDLISGGPRSLHWLRWGTEEITFRSNIEAARRALCAVCAGRVETLDTTRLLKKEYRLLDGSLVDLKTLRLWAECAHQQTERGYGTTATALYETHRERFGFLPKTNRAPTHALKPPETPEAYLERMGKELSCRVQFEQHLLYSLYELHGIANNQYPGR